MKESTGKDKYVRLSSSPGCNASQPSYTDLDCAGREKEV
jgi:hypothetical protein